MVSARALVLLVVMLAAIGCAAPRERTPQALEAIAAQIQARSEAPEYADVQLTGIQVERDHVLVGLRRDAPEFVGEMLSRYGSAVAFVNGPLRPPPP